MTTTPMTEPTPNLLDELRDRYPKAFPADPGAVMPLMLRVHKPLIRAGYDPKAVSAALKEYVNAPAYLEALAAGKPRINLDGETVGFVSEQHQTDAKVWLGSPEGRPALLWKKPKRPAVALSGTIEQPQEPPKKKTMPTIELTATLAKIAVTIDPATFRAVLYLDTIGAKSVPVVIVADGKKYLAQLNSKSFRKAQVAFKEAVNPTVSISGNLKGNAIEAAGIVVFDKGAKPAAEGGEQAKAPEPATVVDTQPTAPATSGTDRPKLALKPKATA
jgi:sRNA-binding protein